MQAYTTTLISLRCWRAAPPAWGRAFSEQVATGLNIVKGGQDPPLKPDAEYPDWLWTLTETDLTTRELREKYEAKEATLPEKCRLLKLETRAKIRGRNTLKAKK